MSKLSRLGMTLVLFGIAVGLAVAVAGCGGGASSATQGPQLLHLHGFDITPDNMRVAVRSLFIENDPASFCAGIKGLSAPAVVEAAKAAQAAQSTSPSPPANSTPVPDQTANPNDDITYAQILIDECNRVAP
jgi:ribosomal protein L12E/L44/L45/RPP1/RPP2